MTALNENRFSSSFAARHSIRLSALLVPRPSSILRKLLMPSQPPKRLVNSASLSISRSDGLTSNSAQRINTSGPTCLSEANNSNPLTARLVNPSHHIVTDGSHQRDACIQCHIQTVCILKQAINQTQKNKRGPQVQTRTTHFIFSISYIFRNPPIMKSSNARSEG